MSHSNSYLGCEVVLSQPLPQVLVPEPVVPPLEVCLHGDREHHVDGVDLVDVEDVESEDHVHGLAAVLAVRVGHGGRVLEVGCWHDHL